MALMICPECGREISDTAEKCVHCGFTIQNCKKNNKKRILLGILIGIAVIVIVVVSVFSYKKQEEKRQAEEYAAMIQEQKEREEQAAEEYQKKILDIWGKLKISDLHGYNNDKAKGILTNNSDTTVYFVKVKFTFKRNNGEIMDTDSTYAVGSEGLEPGESCEFYVYNDYAYGAGYKFTAEVYDFSIQ